MNASRLFWKKFIDLLKRFPLKLHLTLISRFNSKKAKIKTINLVVVYIMDRLKISKELLAKRKRIERKIRTIALLSDSFNKILFAVLPTQFKPEEIILVNVTGIVPHRKIINDKISIDW